MSPDTSDKIMQLIADARHQGELDGHGEVIGLLADAVELLLKEAGRRRPLSEMRLGGPD